MRCASTFLHCAFSKVHISFLLFCTVFALFCTFFAQVQQVGENSSNLAGCRPQFDSDCSWVAAAHNYTEICIQLSRLQNFTLSLHRDAPGFPVIFNAETVLNFLCTDDKPWYTLRAWVVLGQLGLNCIVSFRVLPSTTVQCSPGLVASNPVLLFT